MKVTKTIAALPILTLLVGACASTPKPTLVKATEPIPVYEVQAPNNAENALIRTTLGYTVKEAREIMASTPNPYDISIAECYSQDGDYISELDQLRLRLINDYASRSSKKYIEEYRFKSLYGGK